MTIIKFILALTAMLTTNSLLLKLVLAIYTTYLAILDYKKNEIENLDLILIISFLVFYLTKSNQINLLICVATVSVIWIIIELIIFKNRDQLIFPMGFIDFIYLVILISGYGTLSSSLFGSSLFITSFIISLMATIALILFYIYTNKTSNVPYLYVLAPLMLQLIYFII